LIIAITVTELLKNVTGWKLKIEGTILKLHRTKQVNFCKLKGLHIYPKVTDNKSHGA
jgi:hypothetical protein